jgi:glucose/mannose transport system permease protein
MSLGRACIYAALIVSALAFALPLYVMIATSLKTMAEVRQGNTFALPITWDISGWVDAWSKACTGLNCSGIQVGFWNSVRILVPSTMLSILIGAVNGYALHFWKAPGKTILFGMMMFGAFIPAQLFIYPLIIILSSVGLYNSIVSIIIIHVIFSLPVMALLFRNYFAGIPIEVFKAARVDGAGFWQTFFYIMLPMATPIIIVAVILQVTGIWNDYLFGLTFAGRENLPMTAQLNAIVNTTYGEKAYNINMAATILTAAVPLLVYFISGRWFVRGIAAGAVKG